MSSPEFSDGEAPADKVTEVSGTGIPIRGNDIDTDQIIPARFMKVVTSTAWASSPSSISGSTTRTTRRSTRSTRSSTRARTSWSPTPTSAAARRASTPRRR